MFRLESASARSSARLGVLETPHGALRTPFFMPIATKGAVKTLSSLDMERLGSPILLSNTYHLYLRPGEDVLKAFGGLHRFMSWDGAILTDSGGYQVFSLAKTRKITEEGVTFASHIDGSRHLLTPERSIQIQQAIGSDIAMVLDECTPPDSSEAQLFGIDQGGTDEALRVSHAKDLASIGFDGYAIGGLSVGEPFEDACRIVSALHGVLPTDRPRYFMGGAKPHEIVEYVRRGVDMFDCVLPTRNARHGQLFRFVHDDLTKPDFYETVQIANERFKADSRPLADPVEGDAVASELSRFSYAYLRHLFTVEEVLGQRLATLMNVRFYLELMGRIRQGIADGTL